MALVEAFLEGQRTLLLEQFLNAKAPEHFIATKAQIEYLDILRKGIRKDLMPFFIELSENEEWQKKPQSSQQKRLQPKRQLLRRLKSTTTASFQVLRTTLTQLWQSVLSRLSRKKR